MQINLEQKNLPFLMSYIIVIDGEFTGPSYRKNAMIEFSGVCFNIENQQEVDFFTTYCKMPTGTDWDEKTLVDFWEKPNMKPLFEKYKLDYEKYPDHLEAISLFFNWIQSVISKYGEDNIVICSDHPEVDATWFNYYLDLAGFPPLYQITGSKWKYVVSLSSFHQGVSQVSHSEIQSFKSNSEKHWNHIVAAQIHFGNTTIQVSPNSHRALDDARFLGFNHCEIVNKMEHKKQKKKAYSQNFPLMASGQLFPMKNWKMHHVNTATYSQNLGGTVYINKKAEYPFPGLGYSPTEIKK
jgi:inhibitor of KinA sporulation pathway (predicted exonuclease)